MSYYSKSRDDLVDVFIHKVDVDWENCVFFEEDNVFKS